MAASIVVVTALGVGPIIAGVPLVRLPFRYDNATCSNLTVAQQSVARLSQISQCAIATAPLGFVLTALCFEDN